MADYMFAIMSVDIKMAESLRGSLTADELDDIADTYRRLGDWPPKEVAAHLLQDCSAGQYADVWKNALKSPSIETRATAYGTLTGDFDSYNDFMRDGFLNGSLVDAAIARISSA